MRICSKEDNLYWEECLSLMPRGTQTMSKCPDQYVDGVHPKFIESGKGCYLYDYEGNEYIDFPMSLGPIILGYAHEDVTNAVINRIRKGNIFSLPSRDELKLAQLVSEVVPCAEQVRFARNGTDANVAAIRLARSFNKREKILYCGYHGWADWYASVTRDYGTLKCIKEFAVRFTYNDLEDLENKIKIHNPSAIIMEPTCLTLPDDDYLQNVRHLCDKYQVILIFDEVVTGFRWSLGGAQEYYGVVPDLCTVGKAMANGYPISAICGRKDIMNEFNYILFSPTFGGELSAISAAIATIEILQTKDYNYLWDLGKELVNRILAISQLTSQEVIIKGEALRLHIEFPLFKYKEIHDSVAKDVFHQTMIDKNVLWGNIAYISFAHDKKVLEKVYQAFFESFYMIKKNQMYLSSALRGNLSKQSFRKNI